MPDPTPSLPDLEATTKVVENASKALSDYNDYTVKTGQNLTALDSITIGVKDAFNSFESTLSSYNISIQSTNALTDKQTTQFGMLSAAVLGTKTSFNTLQNIDTSNLSTFTDQIKYLTDSFTDAQSGIGQLVSFARTSFGQMVPQQVIGQGIDAVEAFVSNLAKSADNALRVSNAYIQLSARTGNLSEVFSAAGPNLENLNALLEKQTALTSNATKATGLAPDVIQNYYSQLGTIPKALEETVKSGGSATETISALTASIKLSAGSGRNYSDIIDDMKDAFKDYNIVGEDALQFTARMGEVSNKFGTNLDVVRSSLKETAGLFKMFGNEAEGSANILNSYVESLKNTGLSGDAAVEVVTSMTHGLKDMGIAQKAFLSAQTGGPGGLMGGFQIEKMMRDGKIDQVFEKVRSQMQKQFGKIVSLEEASSSQAAAAQMTRQMLILKQGPLGSFAKDDQSAMRILEGFKAKQEGKVGTTDLSNKIVQDVVNKGTVIQEKSYTELSRIRGVLEEIHGTADIANLGTVQKAGTASLGIQAQLSDNQRKSKQGLMLHMEKNSIEGGAIEQDYARDIKTKAPISDVGKRITSSLSEVHQLFVDLPSSLKAPIDTLKQSMESGKIISASAKAKLEEDLKNAQDASFSNVSSSSVHMAAGRNAGMKRIPLGNNNDHSKENTKQASTKFEPININITGYCIKCKQEIEGGRQLASLNPAAMII